MAKLSKAQVSVIERIGTKLEQLGTLSIGGLEEYEIGFGSVPRTLVAFIKKGMVEKFHRVDPYRRLPGPGCSSHHPDGYTLYKLTPLGAQVIFDKLYKEELEKTLEGRVADRISKYALTPELLKATVEQKAVGAVLREREHDKAANVH